MAQYLYIWVGAYWFSATSLSKWPPGGHIGFLVSGWHGFGSVTQVCFGISVSNFMCMSFVAVDRSLTIVSYVAFKMAALWFLTMFNCNPPIAHCHPLLWGGGILVDHWSTISSFYTPRFNEVERGYTGFTLSVCPSVRLWTELCPLCIFNNDHQIHLIFAHHIKQLQKVCCV